MSQSTPTSSNKKRNYSSPQKTQTTIVAFTNQKASQKKLNSNHTPQRSALSRSQEAMLGLKSPRSTGKDLALSNNPFNALSQEDEEEEILDSSARVSQKASFNKGGDLDTASSKTADTEETESSSTTISSVE
jgi:hypothetical protein